MPGSIWDTFTFTPVGEEITLDQIGKDEVPRNFFDEFTFTPIHEIDEDLKTSAPSVLPEEVEKIEIPKNILDDFTFTPSPQPASSNGGSESETEEIEEPTKTIISFENEQQEPLDKILLPGSVFEPDFTFTPTTSDTSTTQQERE